MMIWRWLYLFLAILNGFNAVIEYKVGNYGWMALDILFAVIMYHFYIRELERQ